MRGQDSYRWDFLPTKIMKINKIDLDKIEELVKPLKNNSLDDWYLTNKYGDWLFEHIPYGWIIYYKYCDVKRRLISNYQRMRYGVSDSECWNLDYTITKFILPRLKHYRKINVNSHPPDITSEQWHQIVDEMIWTFEYMHDEEKFNPTPSIKYDGGDVKTYHIQLTREKTPEQKQAWDDYFKKNDQLEERRKKGLLLFAEYYYQLWD